jgi:hypothetical protein
MARCGKRLFSPTEDAALPERLMKKGHNQPPKLIISIFL